MSLIIVRTMRGRRRDFHWQKFSKRERIVPVCIRPAVSSLYLRIIRGYPRTCRFIYTGIAGCVSGRLKRRPYGGKNIFPVRYGETFVVFSRFSDRTLTTILFRTSPFLVLPLFLHFSVCCSSYFISVLLPQFRQLLEQFAFFVCELFRQLHIEPGIEVAAFLRVVLRHSHTLQAQHRAVLRFG